MAILHPPLSLEQILEHYREEERKGVKAEWDTLHRLASHLSDDFHIFYHLEWRVDVSNKQGEIDFVIIDNVGEVVLLEQKEALLARIDGRLRVKYAKDKDRKDVLSRIAKSTEWLQSQWRKIQSGNLALFLVLYRHNRKFTDQEVDDMGKIPDMIRAVSSFDDLMAFLREKFSPGDSLSDQAAKLITFFETASVLRADVSQRIALRKKQSSRAVVEKERKFLKNALDAKRLYVSGPSGSGKTVLAQKLHENALSLKGDKNSLLLCYNLPLLHTWIEDGFSKSKKGRGHVTNFHTLCHDIWKQKNPGRTYSGWPSTSKDLFDEIENFIDEKTTKYDYIIVDEGQDLGDKVYEILLRLLAEDGHVIWIEDAHQNLGQCAIDGAIPLSASSFRDADFADSHRLCGNYRTPP